MLDKNIENCWEFWNCSRDVQQICPAYKTNSGRECWMIAGTFNPDGKVICPKAKNEFKSCLECPWFKKLNPDL